MHTDKDKITKVNLHGKLRLKRNNSDSSQSMLNLNTKSSSSSHDIDNQETCNNKQSPYNENISRSPNREDTLADFKSPKAETSSRPILSKFKIDNDRAKKKILKPKGKSNVKSRKSTSDIKQPSIESSFFKPQTSHHTEIKESVPCPLCLRAFKDDTACTNHMKNCAAKNKVSVKQLLDAKKLQDRQAEERKAMGLLATPVLPERKKAFRSKKYCTEDDPQLQLVLAMSESLYHAEQMVELEQAALLAGIPTECIKDMNDEECKTTLRNFGFTTNKLATVIPTNKAKRKKLLGPTILQTRSKEDKDRVLTERIACILTGDDALTQAQQKTEIIPRHNEPTSLKSKNLKKIEKLSDKLWDKSRLTKKYNDFYVKDLKSHFLPLVQQVETAQPAGSQVLTYQNDDDDDDTKYNAVLSNISIEYEPMDVDISIGQEMRKGTSNLSNISGSENMDREFEFMRILTLKWRDALNDSAASDLIIFVKNNKQIYVHKLVFHVQCSNILLDIEPNNSEIQSRIKEKISWVIYEELSALAFLEFIYCGTIHENNNIFENDDLLSEVNKLARLYKVPGLFTYLRTKQKELKAKRLKLSESVNNDIPIQENNKDNANIHHSSNTVSTQNCDTSAIKKNLSSQLQPPEINDSISKYNSDPLPFLKNNASLKNLCNRRITASPDLFESEEEEEKEKVYSCKTQENNQTKESANNTNLKILVDLIDADEKESSNDAQSNCQNNAENISSQKTIVNLSGIASPQSDITVPFSPTRDIHDTVTPKDKSPEIYNDVTPERLNYDNEEINQVVTPKAGRSPERYNDVTPEKMDYNNEQLTEAVTPKTRRSPKMDDNSTFETKDFENNDIFKATTPESNISVSLKNHITPKKPVYADIDIENVTSVIASAENGNESMYTAVTPPRTNETDCEPQFELKGENIKKLKTDLSLFIDKVRRVNAKSALDTDSETDTPEFRMTRKNPFLKQQRDDSYAYLKNDGRKNNDQRRVISLLEQDVLKGENKVVSLNPTMQDSSNTSTLENTESHDLSGRKFPNINLSPDLQDKFFKDDPMKNTNGSPLVLKDKSYNFKLPDEDTLKTLAKKDKELSSSISDDEIDDVTVNESEMSMYSRYKKQNKHDNSIAKYRKELNFKNLKENISKYDNTEFNKKTDFEKSTKVSDNPIRKNFITKSDAKIEDITLVSDSDDEEQDRTLDKREFSNQNDLTPKSSDRGNASNLISNAVLADIEDDTAFPLHLIDDNLARFTASKVVSSTVVKETKLKHNVIDLSIDSDEENINDVSTFPYQLAMESESSLENKKFNEKEFVEKAKKNESLEMLKRKNEDIDDEISKILQNSPDFSNQNENLHKRSKKQKNQEQLDEDIYKATSSKNRGGQCKVINLSPISIISSPELCELDREELRGTNPDNLHKIKNNNLNKSNTLSKKKVDGLDTIHNEYLKDLEFEDDWITMPSLEKSVAVKSPKSSSNTSKQNLFSLEKSISPKLSLKSPNSVTRTSQISSLISSPILSQNRQNSRKKTSETTNVRVGKRRKSQSPEQRSKQTRKLQTKSASASNFSEKSTNNKGYNLQRSSSFVTPERNKNSSQKVGKFAKGMTPPIDYSQLDTPELHKELKKYGLKPQTRNRATLLLTHIYNETHPVSVAQKRTSSDNSSDSDEAPPPKRRNLKKTCKKNILKEKVDSNAAQSSQNCPVIAEELDYDEADTANSLENPVSIKDVFTRLLRTNKELYNQVLTYEPLLLEPLHLMLKQNGFKCKLNLLMDFLDEQCITFQVQDCKGNRTKKKERKK